MHKIDSGLGKAKYARCWFSATLSCSCLQNELHSRKGRAVWRPIGLSGRAADSELHVVWGTYNSDRARRNLALA
jgi:hypothetical protein